MKIAKSFAKFDVPIPDGYIRVMFKITIDLDYTNDYGTYIRNNSAFPNEEEWL